MKIFVDCFVVQRAFDYWELQAFKSACYAFGAMLSQCFLSDKSIKTSRQFNDQSISMQMALEYFFVDMVMTSRSPRPKIPFEYALAWVDAGVCFCLDVTVGTISIGQMEQCAFEGFQMVFSDRSFRQRLTDPNIEVDLENEFKKLTLEDCPLTANQIQDEPIVRLAMQRLTSKDHGAGFCFEEAMMRILQLYLSSYPTLDCCPLLQQLNRHDFLKHYHCPRHVRFQALPTAARFIEWLRSFQKPTQPEFLGSFPLNAALVDGCLALTKIPGAPSRLPQFQMIYIQFKYLTASALDVPKLKHALRTVDPDHFFEQRDAKGAVLPDSASRKQYLEAKLNAEFPDSIGIVAMCGAVTQPAVQEVPRYVSASSAHRQFLLFRCDVAPPNGLEGLAPAFQALCNTFQEWLVLQLSECSPASFASLVLDYDSDLIEDLISVPKLKQIAQDSGIPFLSRDNKVFSWLLLVFLGLMTTV